YDPAALVEDEVTIVVQINGRVRDRVVVPQGISTDEMVDRVLAQPRVRQLTEGKRIKKVIPVPGKLVNIVAS
ncbi:MAG: hypothetical protein AB1652_09515, partial [Bacillota bacterium]